MGSLPKAANKMPPTTIVKATANKGVAKVQIFDGPARFSNVIIMIFRIFHT